MLISCLTSSNIFSKHTLKWQYMLISCISIKFHFLLPYLTNAASYNASKETDSSIIEAFGKFGAMYQVRGFKICKLQCDGQFVSCTTVLTTSPHHIQVLPVARNVHSKNAENCIRFVKNRTRCVRLMMPFKRTPNWFLMETTYTVCSSQNQQYPSKRKHEIR